MILPDANRHFRPPPCRSLAEHELNVAAHLATLRWMQAHVDPDTADALREAVTALSTARTLYWSTVWADAETQARFQEHRAFEAMEAEEDDA